MSITYAAYDNVLRDDTGRAIVNAEIYVYRADTGTLAQLYDLAGNPVGQPLSTDQHGGIDNGSTHSAEARQGFRAPGGRYLIRSFKNGVEGRRIPEVMIGGTIVEQGQNANGSYWRWESGLQVCVSPLLSPEYGGFADRAQVQWTYPAGFHATPRALTGRDGSILVPEMAYGVPASLATTTSAALRLIDAEGRFSSGQQFPSVFGLAIGTWK